MLINRHYIFPTRKTLFPFIDADKVEKESINLLRQYWCQLRMLLYGDASPTWNTFVSIVGKVILSIQHNTMICQSLIVQILINFELIKCFFRYLPIPFLWKQRVFNYMSPLELRYICLAHTLIIHVNRMLGQFYWDAISILWPRQIYMQGTTMMIYPAMQV